MSCLVDIRVVEFISLSPIINDLYDKDIRMLNFYEIEINFTNIFFVEFWST